jgi:hypothetical protein
LLESFPFEPAPRYLLLRKLGMSHSTFDQPLPRDWDSLESFVQEISIRRVGVMAKTKRELREVEREPVEKTPTHEEIAQRAYAFYEARGRENGHDLADWLHAEDELLEEKNGRAIRSAKGRAK